MKNIRNIKGISKQKECSPKICSFTNTFEIFGKKAVTLVEVTKAEY